MLLDVKILDGCSMVIVPVSVDCIHALVCYVFVHIIEYGRLVANRQPSVQFVYVGKSNHNMSCTISLTGNVLLSHKLNYMLFDSKKSQQRILRLLLQQLVTLNVIHLWMIFTLHNNFVLSHFL